MELFVAHRMALSRWFRPPDQQETRQRRFASDKTRGAGKTCGTDLKQLKLFDGAALVAGR